MKLAENSMTVVCLAGAPVNGAPVCINSTWELVRKWESQSYKIGKELNSANNLNEKTDDESRSSLRAFREKYGLQYLDLSLVKTVLIFGSLFCIIQVITFW